MSGWTNVAEYNRSGKRENNGTYYQILKYNNKNDNNNNNNNNSNTNKLQSNRIYNFGAVKIYYIYCICLAQISNYVIMKTLALVKRTPDFCNRD